MYREGGDLRGAVELCKAGLAEHPGYLTGRLVLARCYKEQGDLAAAADEYLKVCKVDVRNHVALRMLADIYLTQGRAAAAGSLYAILADMEPDNAEIRGCAARNKQREKGTAAEILGFKAPKTDAAQNLRMGVDPSAGAAPKPEAFQGASGAYPQSQGSAQQQFDGAASQADGAYGAQMPPPPPAAAYGAQSAPARQPKLSDAELNAMFIQPPEPNPVYDTADVAGQTVQPSGDDVAGRLDAVFGEAPSPPQPVSAPAAVAVEPQGAEPSGDDVAGQLDAIFGETPAPEPQMEDDATGQGGQPSGDDFAGRIEAIFGETPPPEAQPIAAMAADSGADASLGGQPSGDDVAGQLDAIFGETSIAAPAPRPADDAEASLGGQPSGDDVAGQLDAIFGETSIATPTPTPTPAPPPADDAAVQDGGRPSGDDVADQLDELFGGQTILSADNIPADAGQPQSSGNAVVDQFDELFGGQAVLSADNIPADFGLSPASGNAVVDQLDELYGGETVLPPAAMPADSIAVEPGLSLMASSGNAVVDQLDELFGGETVLPPAAMPAEGIAASGLPYDIAAGPDFPEPDEAAGVLPDDYGSGFDEAELASALEAVDSEAALAAALEDEGDRASVTGNDVEDRLNAIFNAGAQPPAPDTDAYAPDAMDEAALAAAMEESSSELTAALDGQPPPVSGMDGVAPGIADEAATGAVDEFALIVDGSDAAPADGEEQALAEEPGKTPPSSIVLDENGVDIATPCPEDIEDRLNALYGLSEETPKEDLIVDADVTGVDVEARLSEMYNAADTTTSMPVEEVMGENAVGTDDAVGIGDAIDTSNIVDADTIINADNSVAPDDVGVDNIDTYNALNDALNALDAGSGAADTDDAVNTYNIAEAGDAFGIDAVADADADAGDAGNNVGIYGAGDVDPFVVPDDAAGSYGFMNDPEGCRPAAVDTVDDVQDKIRQLFMAEGADAADGALGAEPLGAEEPLGGAPDAYGVSIAGPDERDTPFDLPDDVLTSTLADIYYQQGQPQLALHIYERLVLRDPSDARLVYKAEEIRGELRLLGEGGALAVAPPPAAIKPEKTPAASSGRKKKGAAAREDVRPLAGVRIKKSTPAKKTKRPKQ
jgi:tetratricopeptide (TPR) repeat protein